MKRVSTAEAKAHLSALLAEVVHEGEPVIIEKQGRARAALVRPETLTSMGLPAIAPVGGRGALDTDILSNLLKPTPSMPLIAKLATVPASDQCTSSITLGEMIYGAARLGARGASLRERSARPRPCHRELVNLNDQKRPLRDM